MSPRTFEEQRLVLSDHKYLFNSLDEELQDEIISLEMLASLDDYAVRRDFSYLKMLISFRTIGIVRTCLLLEIEFDYEVKSYKTFPLSFKLQTFVGDGGRIINGAAMKLFMKSRETFRGREACLQKMKEVLVHDMA